MPTKTISPISVYERIHEIDILRGIALVGILIINFTVDTPNASPYEGWTGFIDQLYYWTIKLLLDDRFQTIYCFLFGLGFAIQIQRANEISSAFLFIFVRRMLVLFLFGIALQLFAGAGFIVISYYAIIGMLLLFFLKIPTKLLLPLALIFFLLPRISNTIDRVNDEKKANLMTQKNIPVDTVTLDKYTGVYQTSSNQPVIVYRKGDSLFGESQNSHFSLIAQSDTQFYREDYSLYYSFCKDSSGSVNKISVTYANYPEYSAVFLTKTQSETEYALKQLIEKKKEPAKTSTKQISYKEFVTKNVSQFRYYYIENFPWENFLWKGNYEMGYILVLFLIGMYAGRHNIFTDVSRNRQALYKTTKWGFIAGGVLVIFMEGFEMWHSFHGIKYWTYYPALTNELLDLGWNTGIISWTIGYLSIFLLLMEKAIWQKRLLIFAPIGRMGLTNYILQAVAYLLLFEPINLFFALEGKVGTFYRLLLAIIISMLLYIYSRWWLNKFNMGPCEWLWRSLAYWKWQPMKKPEPVQIAEIAMLRI